VPGAAGQTGCSSEPTTFSVTEGTIKCPSNVFPENNKVLTLAEARKEITFRWTPITPMPPVPVRYRLKVWQLMEGQSGMQAMKQNKAKVDKDVTDAPETTWPTLLTGPCKPPYLCDFIWNVEMISKDGQTICASEPTVFKIASNDIDIQIDSVYTSCCNSNGVQNVYVKIKNNLGNTVKITNLNIDKVNGVTNVIAIIGLTPALPGQYSRFRFTGIYRNHKMR
jgi:hypothetical protein